MATTPDLGDLIATVVTDSSNGDCLTQLGVASATAGELERIADNVRTFFVEACRAEGRSWSEISRALGVTKQAAHQRFAAPTEQFERFTPRAHAVIRAAGENARSFGHPEIGPEHLLLGLSESGGIAADVLGDTGITLVAIEDRTVRVRPRQPRSESAVLPPLDVTAAETLQRARNEALLFRHNYVGTEHLLLGLFGQPQSLATSILTELGATKDDFRRRVAENLSRYHLPSG